jgi:hypothetical protein
MAIFESQQEGPNLDQIQKYFVRCLLGSIPRFKDPDVLAKRVFSKSLSTLTFSRGLFDRKCFSQELEVRFSVDHLTAYIFFMETEG